MTQKRHSLSLSLLHLAPPPPRPCCQNQSNVRTHAALVARRGAHGVVARGGGRAGRGAHQGEQGPRGCQPGMVTISALCLRQVSTSSRSHASPTTAATRRGSRWKPSVLGSRSRVCVSCCSAWLGQFFYLPLNFHITAAEPLTQFESLIMGHGLARTDPRRKGYASPPQTIPALKASLQMSCHLGRTSRVHAQEALRFHLQPSLAT